MLLGEKRLQFRQVFIVPGQYEVLPSIQTTQDYKPLVLSCVTSARRWPRRRWAKGTRRGRPRSTWEGVGGLSWEIWNYIDSFHSSFELHKLFWKDVSVYLYWSITMYVTHVFTDRRMCIVALVNNATRALKLMSTMLTWSNVVACCARWRRLDRVLRLEVSDCGRGNKAAARQITPRRG